MHAKKRRFAVTGEQHLLHPWRGNARGARGDAPNEPAVYHGEAKETVAGEFDA